MDYISIHNSIIDRAFKRNKPDGYCEKHHILPTSMGGLNIAENKVWLTGKEHYLVHWMLFKIHRNKPMAFAWYRMTHSRSDKKRYSSRSFVYAKKARNEIVSAMFTGKKLTNEHKAKLRMAKLGKKKNYPSKLIGRKASPETRLKISLSNTGRKHTEESKEKCRISKLGENNHRFGKQVSESTRTKLRNSQLGKSKKTCDLWASNTSGHKGVSASRGGWQVSIKVLEKHIFLGRYKNIEDAIASRKAAELKYTSKN